ncbi:hypothetical protein H4582DRAFT_2059288 [Lactarius indigo]|nr:hypothetical protein H4582DRAFT_2059288 [Lactarius indigo]
MSPCANAKANVVQVYVRKKTRRGETPVDGVTRAIDIQVSRRGRTPTGKGRRTCSPDLSLAPFVVPSVAPFYDLSLSRGRQGARLLSRFRPMTTMIVAKVRVMVATVAPLLRGQRRPPRPAESRGSAPVPVGDAIVMHLERQDGAQGILEPKKYTDGSGGIIKWFRHENYFEREGEGGTGGREVNGMGRLTASDSSGI